MDTSPEVAFAPREETTVVILTIILFPQTQTQEAKPIIAGPPGTTLMSPFHTNAVCARLSCKEKICANIPIPLQLTQPGVGAPGFVVFEPLSGTSMGQQTPLVTAPRSQAKSHGLNEVRGTTKTPSGL